MAVWFCMARFGPLASIGSAQPLSTLRIIGCPRPLIAEQSVLSTINHEAVVHLLAA